VKIPLVEVVRYLIIYFRVPKAGGARPLVDGVRQLIIYFRVPKTGGAREEFYSDTYYFYGVSDARVLY
jgi:hypothetical protein